MVTGQKVFETLQTSHWKSFKRNGLRMVCGLIRGTARAFPQGMKRGCERNTTRTSQTGSLPVLVSLVLLVLSASQLQSQSVPGTVIRNLATVNYQAATGASFAPVTDSALVTVGSASGIAVLLAKNVDRASGTLGDIVTYTITYQGLGSAVATNLVIGDLLPAGATYVAASMSLDGAPLSDATGDDAGEFAAGRVAVTIPAVTGGATGTVVFQARLDGTASPSNIARADYVTPLGADSAQSNAVQTTLLFASVSVTKLLDSPVAPAIARVGDVVSYRIRYSTAAGVIARNVIVTDTLPAGLQYVSATPAATVSGSVLTWALGDVAAGTTTDITLQTTVPATLPDSITVINTAALAADNAPGAAAAAPAVLLQLAVPGQLALVKTVDVLEVSLGETAPYTLTLQNTGGSALNDLRVSDRLPEGSRYATGSALGADSVTANGRDLIFYIAGPLAPGATQTVRYRVAVVSADQDVLENRALASAEAGTIQSAESRAWVRVRRSWPLETRAVIGKVFVDENRNGRQDSGELGISGVDVWTDDGEITTTDSEGRFSFQNLRPGQHAYHIDAVTLPSAFDAGATPIVMRDGSGWTTPRVNFAVVPAAAGTTAAGTTAAGTTAAGTTAAGTTAAGTTAAGPRRYYGGVPRHYGGRYYGGRYYGGRYYGGRYSAAAYHAAASPPPSAAAVTSRRCISAAAPRFRVRVRRRGARQSWRPGHHCLFPEEQCSAPLRHRRRRDRPARAGAAAGPFRLCRANHRLHGQQRRAWRAVLEQ